MYKNEIEINELNKLYDEIYYGNYEEVESTLDILTNCISEKEYQEFEVFPKTMTDIMDIIIELYQEIIEVLDDEGISEIKNLVSEKKHRILNREMDEILESEYIKYLDEDYDGTLIDDNKEGYEDDYEDAGYTEKDDVFHTEDEDLNVEEELDENYNDNYDDY